jgi:putative chitinase
MTATLCSAEVLDGVFQRAGLDDETRHFLVACRLFTGKAEDDVRKLAASLARGTGDFRHMHENSSGKRYELRPDLGNTEVGDGLKFIGRGLIQRKGRTSYAAFQEYLRACGGELARLDVMSNPDLVATDPRLRALTVDFFLGKKWTPGMSVLDLRGAINQKGGRWDGFDDTLKKYLDSLPDDETRTFAIAQERIAYERAAVMYRGQRDFSYRIGVTEHLFNRVAVLQRQLGMAYVDGVYGLETEAAVQDFQRLHGLVVDGMVGPKTASAIAKACDKACEAAKTPAADSTRDESKADGATPRPQKNSITTLPVVSGDTLRASAIALAHSTTVNQQTIECNPSITNPGVINAGAHSKLPVLSAKHAPQPQAGKGPPPAPKAPPSEPQAQQPQAPSEWAQTATASTAAAAGAVTP